MIYYVRRLKQIEVSGLLHDEYSPYLKQISYDVYGSRLATLEKYIEPDNLFLRRIRNESLSIINNTKIQFCISSAVSSDDRPSCITYLQELNSNMSVAGDTYTLPTPPQALIDAYNSIYSSDGSFPYLQIALTRNKCFQEDYDATASWLESLNGN